MSGWRAPASERPSDPVVSWALVFWLVWWRHIGPQPASGLPASAPRWSAEVIDGRYLRATLEPRFGGGWMEWE